MGQLNWLASISHPEISLDVCQASALITSATVADIVDINKVYSGGSQPGHQVHATRSKI